MTRDQEVIRGNDAKAILENEAYRAALAMARQQFVDDWLAAPTADTREAAHYAIKGLETFVRKLETILGRGHLAKRAIEHEAEAAARPGA